MAKTNSWGIETDSIRKQICKRQRKKLFNWRTRKLSSGVGIKETPFLSLRKKDIYIYRSPSIETTN